MRQRFHGSDSASVHSRWGLGLKRNSRQSEPIKAAIVAKRALGESKAQIARDLELAESTVTDVLDSCDFKALIESGRIRVHRLIPRACDAIEMALDEGNGNIGIKILQGVGVLQSESSIGSVNATVNFHCHIEEPGRER